MQLDLHKHCLKFERHSLKLYKHMNLQGSTRTMKTCLEIGMIENITGSPCTKKNLFCLTKSNKAIDQISAYCTIKMMIGFNILSIS